MNCEKNVINKFLDRNYRIEYNSRGMYLIDINTTERLEVSKFKDIMFLLFTPDLFDYVVEWGEEVKKTLFEPFDNFLGDYHVILGRREWDVVKITDNRIKLKYDEFLNKFNWKFTEEFISYYYKKWYERIVIEASEKEMGIKY